MNSHKRNALMNYYNKTMILLRACLITIIWIYSTIESSNSEVFHFLCKLQFSRNRVFVLSSVRQFSVIFLIW